MSNQIEEIELDQIVPSPTNPRKYFNQQGLEELAASIKQTKGVIQAVTVRPHPSIKNKYELVCGERRYRSSKIAGMPTISSVIKDLTDEEVQELQFIENIEREDVHPMDEAVTFKAMIENKIKPWTVDDIAAKITKPASYVAQRLQLNHLIPSLQKEFWDGKFLVGHAILFARLSDADQKQLVNNYSVSWSGVYKPVKDVAKYIETNVMCKLSAASFDKEDATLVPAAGACSMCSKRTGNNPSLFADLKTDDRCTDRTCFNSKSEAHVMISLEETLSTKPDVFLLKTSEPSTMVKKMAEKFKVNILSVYDHTVSLHKQSTYTKLKGLYVSGEEKGKLITFYRKMSGSAAKAAAGEKITAKDIDDQIKAVNQRLDRSKELDYEKEQIKIAKAVNDVFDDDKILDAALRPSDREFLIRFFLADFLMNRCAVIDELELESFDTPAELFDKLEKLNPPQADSLLLHAIIEKCGSSRFEGESTEIIRKIAIILNVDLRSITSAQAAARTKREANAAKKIEVLQKQKDALLPATKKTASKKVHAPSVDKVVTDLANAFEKSGKKTGLAKGIDALIDGAANAVKKSGKKSTGKNKKAAA